MNYDYSYQKSAPPIDDFHAFENQNRSIKPSVEYFIGQTNEAFRKVMGIEVYHVEDDDKIVKYDELKDKSEIN